MALPCPSDCDMDTTSSTIDDSYEDAASFIDEKRSLRPAMAGAPFAFPPPEHRSSVAAELDNVHGVEAALDDPAMAKRTRADGSGADCG